MGISTLLHHPAQLLSIIAHFIPWYFLEMPKRIVRGYREYLRAIGEIFSFWFLIKTFLKPWKSIVDKYPKKGFNIGLIAQAFTLNCTSRIIGMIFRLTALLLGIVVEVIAFAIFIAVLGVWLMFPVILILDVFFLIGTFL